MKMRNNYAWTVGLVMLVAFIASLFYVRSLEAPDSRGLLFVNIGLNQMDLATESSSYEILRATEHFSDMLIAWTIEPSFERELETLIGYDLNLKAERQEKSNLLFYLSAEPGLFDGTADEALLTLIKSRISDYNYATNAGYTVTFSKYSDLESFRADGQFIVGITLLAGVVMTFVLMLKDYASQDRHRFKTLA